VGDSKDLGPPIVLVAVPGVLAASIGGVNLPVVGVGGPSPVAGVVVPGLPAAGIVVPGLPAAGVGGPSPVAGVVVLVLGLPIAGVVVVVVVLVLGLPIAGVGVGVGVGIPVAGLGIGIGIGVVVGLVSLSSSDSPLLALALASVSFSSSRCSRCHLQTPRCSRCRGCHCGCAGSCWHCPRCFRRQPPLRCPRCHWMGAGLGFGQRRPEQEGAGGLPLPDEHVGGGGDRDPAGLKSKFSSKKRKK